MRKKIMRYGLLTTCVFMFLGLVGCGDTDNSNNKYELDATTTIESDFVAQNDNYILKYDDDKHNIVFESKDMSTSWATTPLEYDGEDVDVLSALKIQVIHNIAKTLDFDRAYTACVETEKYSVEKIEDGMKATYYFDTYQISVPVTYKLREDSLEISVDTAEICEGEDYRLLSIDIAPFLGAVKNDTVDSYLMVPSANGALMYTDTRPDGTRTYSAEVYGQDASRVIWEKPIAEDAVKMPIFGVKRGQDALFAIVENGAEATVINGVAGNDATGYSNAYVSISVRGHDVFADEIDANSTTTVRNADNITDMNVSIAYYPLQGAEANYNGMAKLYKQYLTEKGMEKTEEEDLYAISILGGIRTRSLMFGVPYYSVKSMTNFEESVAIVEDLAKQTGNYPAVQLVGYGESGINVGKIAGGYQFHKVNGKEADYQKLEQLAAEEDFLLSVDFDVVRFNKTSSKVNTWMDTAKSSSLYKAESFYNTVALSDYDQESESYYLVKRSQLTEIVDTLAKKAKEMNISGVSLSSLGQLAYSDYSEKQFFTKGATEKSVAQYIKTLSDSDFKIVTDNANIYAAIHSDAVLNVVTEVAELNALDDYIPFYQMILLGTKPLYSEALNLTGNEEKNLLRALESGTRPGYTLIGDYDTSYASSVHTNLYNSLYSDVKERIAGHMSAYSDYYTAIENASIASYEIIESGVSKTVFDNGINAYTNKTDKDIQTEIGVLKAMSFVYTKGE